MPRSSTAKTFLLRSLASVCLISAVVLGYGYWHSATHAAFQVDLYQLTSPGERHAMPLAKVVFKDDQGRTLATGVSDEKYHYVHLLHPEVGDCYQLESVATTSRKGRTAWQECYAELATWVPQWAGRVHSVDVSYKNKLYEKVPVKVRRYNSEWPLWWVPLPHIGGKPYTYYSTDIRLETSQH